MDLEAFELVVLRRPAQPASYDDETLERIQREHLAYHASLREMTWYCPPGTMARPGKKVTL